MKKMKSNQIIFYSTPLGKIKVEVIFKEETFWLTQKAMAMLFGVEVPGISKHLSKIYETNELQKEATISILETVQQEGSRNIKRKVEYYRLEAILAVGYRVNSAANPELDEVVQKISQKLMDVVANLRKIYFCKRVFFWEKCVPLQNNFKNNLLYS